MIQLRVEGIPPTLNELRRMGHYQQAREKKKWEKRVEHSAEGLVPPSPIEKSIVLYRFFFSNHNRRDTTNLYGAVKILEDGLVRVGILQDDSCSHTIPVAIPCGVDKENPRVEMQVMPVTDLQIERMIQQWAIGDSGQNSSFASDYSS